MSELNRLVDELRLQNSLPKFELLKLLAAHQDEGLRSYLASQAQLVRQKHFGRDVYLRALIEFSSYCQNDCYYCGLRRSNKRAQRYRLTESEILAACAQAYDLGLRTFVLQSGEDPYFTCERLSNLVKTIAAKFPAAAITLSVGEMGGELYAALRRAGAARFLLRHETANESHYGLLHPQEMAWANRRRCLFELKALGFQVGAGFMVGSPGQTLEHLIEDLLFLSELQPHMVGIGPFIPHPDTPFADYPPGEAELTIFLLGLVRLILPQALLPATTALGTISPTGRFDALAFGANVMMPNLSPANVRSKYEIYKGKIHQGQEAAEGVELLRANLRALGYDAPISRGDARGFEE